MKKLSFLLILCVLLLSACGGGGGASTNTNNGAGTPTGTSIDFNIFPPGFFTSYNVSANLSGSDIRGGTYTGTTADALQIQTTFLGDPALPVQGVISFTISNGGFGTATLFSYFSTAANDRRFLGVSGDVTTVSANTSAIPLTAKIGNSGVMGNYMDNAGFNTSVTWRLDDGFNGRANLMITNVTTDASGAIDNTMQTTYLIEPDGSRVSVKYVTTNLNVSNVVTLTGDY